MKIFYLLTWIFVLSFGIKDAMNCADDLVKFLSKWVLEHCMDDMKFVQKRIDKNSIHRLESIMSCSFEKVSYTTAIEILEKVKSHLLFYHVTQFFISTPAHLNVEKKNLHCQATNQKSPHLKKLKFGAALTDDHLRCAKCAITVGH